MPMRWTAEADAHLLLKILEVHQIAVNHAGVAAAWDLGDEKPTPKAVSEHVAKLKRMARSGTSGPAAADAAPASSPATATATPRKRGRPAANGGASGNPSTPRRKRNPVKTPITPTPGPNIKEEEEEEVEGEEQLGPEADISHLHKTPFFGASSPTPARVKREYVGDDFEERDEEENGFEPTSKRRRLRTLSSTLLGEEADGADNDDFLGADSNAEPPSWTNFQGAYPGSGTGNMLDGAAEQDVADGGVEMW